MSGPAYVSEPTVQYLHQLLEELAKGYVQIPQFQRDFVWKDDQRLQLLQSIREGIPIGSILVWRTGLTALKTIRSIGPHRLPEPTPSPTSSRTYLLDGLQRLSTLYGCLRPLPAGVEPFVVDDEGKEVSWRVGFDLGTEKFVILDRGDVAPPTWLPLNRLLDSVQLLQFQRGLPIKDGVDELVQRADALAETFRTYKLPVVPVVTEDLASATRTFERVNQQGTPMSELNMVRALTWNEAFDLEERLSAVREELAEVGWESLEPEWILKTCKAALAIDISVEAPDETSARLAKHPDVIAATARNLRRVAAWLAVHCGVPSPKTVPYRMQIVMLAEALRLSGELEEKANVPASTFVRALRQRDRESQRTRMNRQLTQWFWYTTYTERFAGITGGQTSAMLESIRSVARGQPYRPKGKERGPSFALPSNFNSSWVRVKAIALRLAALRPLDLDGTDLEAAGQLAHHGPSALVPLAPAMKGIAARMFNRPDSILRAALLDDATKIEQRILTSHAITPEAAQALASKDLATFLALRGAEIQRLEEAFYDATQEPESDALAAQ